ncbi:MAG: hypothetical protein OXE52_16730, partial [Chloroflexi bacterium]|nr:hypothetical protein [Chloroflexota bacterium]
LTYDQFDVTGFGDEVHKYINGQLRAPVTIQGYLTTDGVSGTHTVIQGAFAAGSQVSLEVQVGDNAAPTTSDPKYSGEFLVSSYRPQIRSAGRGCLPRPCSRRQARRRPGARSSRRFTIIRLGAARRLVTGRAAHPPIH